MTIERETDLHLSSLVRICMHKIMVKFLSVLVSNSHKNKQNIKVKILENKTNVNRYESLSCESIFCIKNYCSKINYCVNGKYLHSKIFSISTKHMFNQWNLNTNWSIQTYLRVHKFSNVYLKYDSSRTDEYKKDRSMNIIFTSQSTCIAFKRPF